ncbi:Uncharacterized protein Fot_04847 [Forsythia ovata]|uniref:Transmembrane protein n=1 Tax=Forsythia ovata TaxID=205694 RepID=A0ABD1WRB0_9LAMI
MEDENFVHSMEVCKFFEPFLSDKADSATFSSSTAVASFSPPTTGFSTFSTSGSGCCGASYSTTAIVGVSATQTSDTTIPSVIYFLVSSAIITLFSSIIKQFQENKPNTKKNESFAKYQMI